MDKLEPLYYLIGFLVISNLGSIISKIMDLRQDKDKDLAKLTEAVIKLETKMEIFSKDLNNIGKKLRGG